MNNSMVTHSDRVNLNIPLPLLKDVKSLKQAMELLALAVAIKCKYLDSRMPNVSATAIQHLLSCGYDKAKRLLAAAKDYPKLFAYNPKTNSLLAINMMRPYYSYAKSCTGETMLDVHCYALEIKRYTLKELCKKFKQILLQYSIWAKEMKERAKDALLFKSKNHKKNLSFIRTSPISQHSLAKATGEKNRKGVYRLSKRMERNETLSIERKGLRYAGFHAWQKEEMAQRFDPQTMMILPHDGAVCYKDYNRYTMVESEMKRFRHVIFNHRVRKNSVYEKQPKESAFAQDSHPSVCLATTTVDGSKIGEIVNPFAEECARPKRSVEEVLAMIDMHDAEDRKF